MARQHTSPSPHHHHCPPHPASRPAPALTAHLPSPARPSPAQERAFLRFLRFLLLFLRIDMAGERRAAERLFAFIGVWLHFSHIFCFFSLETIELTTISLEFIFSSLSSLSSLLDRIETLLFIHCNTLMAVTCPASLHSHYFSSFSKPPIFTYFLCITDIETGRASLRHLILFSSSLSREIEPDTVPASP